MSDYTKECPYCAELIKTKAQKCHHCGEFLEDVAAKGDKTVPKSEADLRQSVRDEQYEIALSGSHPLKIRSKSGYELTYSNVPFRTIMGQQQLILLDQERLTNE